MLRRKQSVKRRRSSSSSMVLRSTPRRDHQKQRATAEATINLHCDGKENCAPDAAPPRKLLKLGGGAQGASGVVMCGTQDARLEL